MTAAGEILRDLIRREGPIPFRRFMETALYHAEHGYYRHAGDRFGVAGDFFTAEQVQPAFGILIAAVIGRLREEMGAPDDFTVVELGAGREEMAEFFREWRYLPVDVDRGALPDRFHGVVFSNEFFDALAVDVAVYRDGAFRERRVDLAGEGFGWCDAERVGAELDDYYRRFFPPPVEGNVYEASLAALRWIERIARSLESGYALTIDYGYTMREWVRFPLGTLMGYRRHTAREAVLEEPGERDITAHVNFAALEAAGAAHGLETLRFETLARTLLDAGERDQFARVLDTADAKEQLRRRMQLKTLLFGMGETFRTLLVRKTRK
jgi:SAM-dependent MidA family methyltransferase